MQTRMKKITLLLCCVFFCVVYLSQTAFAANNVSEIQVDVVLSDDGSAYITQTWNCSLNEGTECYFPIENLGDRSITGFTVSDSDGAYTSLDNWDVGASFSEKAGKCGMVKTDRGWELCWGIGEYGERRYAVEYQISGLVSGYTDFDGLLFQFVNPGMGTLPTDVTVKITTRDGITLDAEHCGIWAFGFDGQAYFEDGQALAYTEKPLSSDTDSVIVMLQLNKGLLHPVRTEDGTFEAVKEKAFAGSDYDYDGGPDVGQGGDAVEAEEYSFTDLTLGLIGFAIPVVLVFFLLTRKGKRKKKLKALYKNVEYFREVPIAGNLEATFALAYNYGQTKDDGDLIGAAFLRLIHAGCLEPMSEKTVGFFGREKESISLRLLHPPKFGGVAANKLYELLVMTSGSDQILQERELQQYCSKNTDAIIRIVSAAREDGDKTLNQIKCFDLAKTAKPLGLTPRGETLLRNIMGFKKYLLDFSLIGERTIAESVIWQDYLTFAALLGIADKAMEQFKAVYPEATGYSENAQYSYLLAYRFRRASFDAAQAARSAGGGGHSSFGGGGGFSGGGHGGGTR